MRIAAHIVLCASLATLTACGEDTSKPRGPVDVAPFRQMAQQNTCATTTNRLFLIDGNLVFWDWAGACSDAAYGRELFGSAPDQPLCRDADSIAGPVTGCQDERYRPLFDTIIGHLDEPDLGLGAGHTVEPITL